MARISHAACNHPSTKVARAACRRAMKKATPAVESAIITAWNAMKNGPLELTAAPARRVSFDVTRENWRDVKGMTAVITTDAKFGDDQVREGMITGWSAKLLQYKTAEGKTVRIPAERVKGVTA